MITPSQRLSYAIEAHHCEDHAELLIRFALWCASLSEPPSRDRIIEHWGFSRATAYRYLRAYSVAAGIYTPRPKGSARAHAAEERAARKAAVNLRRCSFTAPESCRLCAAFRPWLYRSPWGYCQRNTFHVRVSEICSAFTAKPGQPAPEERTTP